MGSWGSVHRESASALIANLFTLERKIQGIRLQLSEHWLHNKSSTSFHSRIIYEVVYEVYEYEVLSWLGFLLAEEFVSESIYLYTSNIPFFRWILVDLIKLHSCHLLQCKYYLCLQYLWFLWYLPSAPLFLLQYVAIFSMLVYATN